MNAPRDSDTATLLPNGLVLAAGGLGGGNSAELYNPTNGIWTVTGSMTNGHWGHTATLLPNGKVLVAGDGGPVSAELYDPVTTMWTSTGSMIYPVHWHTATLLTNGQVLVAGGYNGSALNDAEIYDPASGTWKYTGALATARFGHTATLLANGKVLVTGGSGGAGNYFNSAELYNPATGWWTTIASMSQARLDATATLLPNGKVLVAGGYESGYPAVTELYDPTAGTWTATGSLNQPRYEHTATLLRNGKVLVAGGWAYPPGGYLTSAELYDPATAAWTSTSSLATSRWQHTATLLPNGEVLVAGGGNNSSYFSSAEVYDVGLGFNASSQPQIPAFSPPLGLGYSLSLTGSLFRGISEGSCGDSQDSPADYPVVQLHSLGNEQTLFLPTTSWSTNSFTSTPVTNFPPGYALATIFVNGIPSASSILDVEDLSGFAIASILQQGTNIVITWTTYAGKTNVVQVSPGAPDGSYTTNFTDFTPPIIVPGSGLVSTNWPDVSATTNSARYYRVRLVP